MLTSMTSQLRAPRRLAAAALSFLALTIGWVEVGAAQMTIRRPGDRPDYKVELEPHLLIAPFEPLGPGVGTGVGAGFRATIDIVPEGFIKRINDSVGIGFGIDGIHYGGNGNFRGDCARFEGGPAGTRICTEVDTYGDASNYVFGEAVMQWNFWLHRRWSVFGEPGLAFYLGDLGYRSRPGVSPVLFIGGRFHFTENVTLTLRLGYPAFSLGVSFLL
ncbi:hypothetical protein SOCEGT47_049610 [Sorangium cellulosum]|jgi:hypothetical protein|uniref:Uncharacterized protein n=2 Tax=Sorangium cellulosum TaxID=56 RepID=A0A4P2Q4U4_SORCE|nr:hypothetical protein SOCEGT47_049610 [Sorangium cellulosum]